MLEGATTLGHLRSWAGGQRSLQGPCIDTTAPIGEAMPRITIVWAGLEKQTLSERTRASMERARGEGKQLTDDLVARLDQATQDLLGSRLASESRLRGYRAVVHECSSC